MAVRRACLISFLVALMVAICAIHLASGAVWQQLVDYDQAHPDTCIYTPKNIRIRIGESAPVQGQCATASCVARRSDDKIVISYVGCGFVGEMEGCRIVEDIEKPHPECCPRLNCSATTSH